MEILDLIRRASFALFVITLPTQNSFVSIVQASHDERVIIEAFQQPFHSVNLNLRHLILFNLDCQIMSVKKGLLQKVRRSIQAPEELYREG